MPSTASLSPVNMARSNLRSALSIRRRSAGTYVEFERKTRVKIDFYIGTIKNGWSFLIRQRKQIVTQNKAIFKQGPF